MRLTERQYHRLTSALASIDLDDEALAAPDRRLVKTTCEAVEVFGARLAIRERQYHRLLSIAERQGPKHVR